MKAANLLKFKSRAMEKDCSLRTYLFKIVKNGENSKNFDIAGEKVWKESF